MCEEGHMVNDLMQAFHAFLEKKEAGKHNATQETATIRSKASR